MNQSAGPFVVALCCLVTFEFFSLLKQLQAQEFLEGIIPVACEPLTENNGNVVHIDCPLRGQLDFEIPAAFRTNLPAFRGTFLEMRVEMFQNALQFGLSSISFTGVWSDHVLNPPMKWPWHPIGGSGEKSMFIPSIPGSGRRFATELYGGGYLLDTPHLVDFKRKALLPLLEDDVYAPPRERPPTSVNSHNTRVWDNMLYTGDPQNPKFGDIRISFYGSTATHVSAIGIQTPSKWSPSKTTLTGFLNPFDPEGSKNETIVAEGDVEPTALVENMRMEHDAWTPFLLPLRCLLIFTGAFAYYHYTIERLSAPTAKGALIFHSIVFNIALVLIISGVFTIFINPISGAIEITLGCSKYFGAMLLHYLCLTPTPTAPAALGSTYNPIIDQTLTEVELQHKEMQPLTSPYVPTKHKLSV